MKKITVIISLALVLCMLIVSSIQAVAVNGSNGSYNTQEKYKSDIESIQNDVSLKDEDKIKHIIEKLFAMKAEGYKEDVEYDFNIFFDYSKELSKNLKYFEDKAKFDIGMKNRSKIKINWCKSTVDFMEVNVDNTSASIKVYASRNYQIGSLSQSSFEGAQYNIDLVKIDNKWMIANIVSNSSFDKTYSESGLDLNTELNAPEKQDNIESSQSISAKINAMNAKKNLALAAGYTDTTYNRTSAANYATTYASYSLRNRNFWYYDSDCQCYASQAVWAGFGGIATDSSSINYKLFPMVNLGLNGVRSWYQTATQYDTPNNNSWVSCTAFKNYITAGGDIIGPYGFKYSGVNWAHIGDIIHVIWANGTGRHAMIVVGFTPDSVYGSRTRDQIYVSAHTGDCNYAPLTSQVITADTLYTEVIAGNLK